MSDTAGNKNLDFTDPVKALQPALNLVPTTLSVFRDYEMGNQRDQPERDWLLLELVHGRLSLQGLPHRLLKALHVLDYVRRENFHRDHHVRQRTDPLCSSEATLLSFARPA